MVGLDNPNCNSQRIQRAKRINGIEQGRLQQRINLLDKEQIRVLRLHRQDVRMINLTMEFISSSTGHSPEGWSPDYCPNEEQRRALASCFMYGDRLNSRRFGKNRNFETVAPSSGVDSSVSPRGANVQQRPQSSPAKRIRKSPGDSAAPTPRPHTAREGPTSFLKPGFDRSDSAGRRSSARSSHRQKPLNTSEVMAEIYANRQEEPMEGGKLLASQSRAQLIDAKRQKLMSINSYALGGSGSARQKKVLESRRSEARQHITLVNDRVNLFNKTRTNAWVKLS